MNIGANHQRNGMAAQINISVGITIDSVVDLILAKTDNSVPLWRVDCIPMSFCPVIFNSDYGIEPSRPSLSSSAISRFSAYPRA